MRDPSGGRSGLSSDGAEVGGGGSGGEPERPVDGASCDVASDPCGGDVVGTWHVVNCPLELTGNVNLLGFGLGCPSGPIASSTMEVSGTWVVDESGRIEDRTTTRGTQEFHVPQSCLDVAVLVTCDRLWRPFSALGYETIACVDDAERGGCNCSGTFNQKGGLAAVSFYPLEMRSYSVSDTRLTVSNPEEETTYDYCATTDTLILAPTPSAVGTVRGSVVLLRE